MGARNREGIGCRTDPPSYIDWRNRFLGIDSRAPWTFINSGSASGAIHIQYRRHEIPYRISITEITMGGKGMGSFLFHLGHTSYLRYFSRLPFNKKTVFYWESVPTKITYSEYRSLCCSNFKLLFIAAWIQAGLPASLIHANIFLRGKKVANTMDKLEYLDQVLKRKIGSLLYIRLCVAVQIDRRRKTENGE